MHHRQPRGSVVVGGKRVYGYLEPFPPVVVSWDDYKLHQRDLIQASYNKSILEKLFPGREFPNLFFTYHQIRFLTWEQLCMLCKAFGITTNRQNSLRRRALRTFIKENC